MFKPKDMSEEQIKEAMEVVEKLSKQLDEVETCLEQLATIGCDNYQLDLILTISNAVRNLSTIKEDMAFYKRPIAWR